MGCGCGVFFFMLILSLCVIQHEQNPFLYRAKLHRANVHFLSAPIKDGTTGTVIVLTTPDAQRTMLAYQVKISLPDQFLHMAACIFLFSV